MKQSLSFFFVLTCAVVLSAHESHAKKGCMAYGHACYGGHGKRSLGGSVDVSGGSDSSTGEQEENRPDAILQVLTNKATALDGDIDTYPKNRLSKIMKRLFSGKHRRPAMHSNEFDYTMSNEIFNNDNSFN